MARSKATLSSENLIALGADKLAALVLDQCGRDAGFKRLVGTTLAVASGPKAAAALIDRRLAALEKAKSFVQWDKEKAFAADLESLVRAIAQELGSADPGMACERLIRFLATHPSVFNRIDDSRGAIQAVYHEALEPLGGLVARMPAADRGALPALVMAGEDRDTHGFLTPMVAAVSEHLGEADLEAWDTQIRERIAALTAKSANPSTGQRVDWGRLARQDSLTDCRQEIALARKDIDGFVALETAKPPEQQDTLDTASRLLAAGRPKEALEWVRRRSGRRIGMMTAAGMADGTQIQDPTDARHAGLEVKILDALGEKAAAQALRWKTFEKMLIPTPLRDYIANLPDFEEFDELDRAFAHVMGHKHHYQALEFLLEWPDLARAAKLVLDRLGKWDGRHYDVLAPAAEALQHDFSAAATVLYRALLDDILTRAKSPAYGHGAAYLARLASLAEGIAGDARLETHATYHARILKAHGRKSGFWALVKAGK